MEELKAAIADSILPYIDLDALARALQVREAGLPHQPVGNDTPGDAHFPFVGFQFRPGSLLVGIDQRGRSVRPAKFARKWVEAQGLNLLEFLLALLELVARLKLQEGKVLSGGNCRRV